jgi:hypothetical protein
MAGHSCGWAGAGQPGPPAAAPRDRGGFSLAGRDQANCPCPAGRYPATADIVTVAAS